MSLISWRRVQGGGYGDGRSDSVISWAENNVATCLSSTQPFTFVSKGQNMERQQEGKRSIVGCPTIKDHNVSLGASSGLPLPRLSSLL